jgi:hypothetical protein
MIVELITALCDLDSEDVIALVAITLFTGVLLLYAAVVSGSL